MALSTKKTNIIIADAKAKKYETITALCKHHGISSRTYYNLEKKHSFKYGENSGIVEAGVILERAKSNLKTSQEVHSVEQAIKQKICTIDMDNKIIDNNRKLATLVQSRILANKESIDADNARNVTTALKDLEAIANPQTKDTNMQINTQINQAPPKIVVEFKE